MFQMEQTALCLEKREWDIVKQSKSCQLRTFYSLKWLGNSTRGEDIMKTSKNEI